MKIYTQVGKYIRKKLKKTSEDGKISHAHASAESIL
jgi:hypothetical protein